MVDEEFVASDDGELETASATDLTRSLRTEPIRLDRRINTDKRLPAGVSVAFMSDLRPEVSIAETDFDYVDGQWLDVRALPDGSMLMPELVCEFRNVWLNATGAIYLANGRPITSLSMHIQRPADFAIPPDDDRFQPQRRQSSDYDYSGTWASIAYGAPGFGHWFIHRMSRVATIARSFPGVPFLITPGLLSGEMVWNAFGIPASHVHELPVDRHRYVRVERLLVPSFAQPVKFPRVVDAPRMRADADDFITGTMAAATRSERRKVERTEVPPFVYLGRELNAPRSGAGNAREIQAAFERRGFVNIEIASLSPAAQMHLMQNVQVIAGESGSFSMNSLFSPPGLGVITVATGTGPGPGPYVPGAKTYTRAATDAGRHHQRRIIASPLTRSPGWIADIDVIENALDSMPEIPLR